MFPSRSFFYTTSSIFFLSESILFNENPLRFIATKEFTEILKIYFSSLCALWFHFSSLCFMKLLTVSVVFMLQTKKLPCTIPVIDILAVQLSIKNQFHKYIYCYRFHMRNRTVTFRPLIGQGLAFSLYFLIYTFFL